MATAAVRTTTGIVRLGKRTKHLVKRLRPGEIAVIAHRDLDRVSGEDLVATGVRAVINTQPYSTGSYPNMGPVLLAQAGLHVVECLREDLFKILEEGDEVELRGGQVCRRGEVIAEGEELDAAQVMSRNEELRDQIGDALEAFARNTVEHMIEERELLSGKLELPRFRTDFRDRHALIVVRGVDHRRDLRALRPYVRDVRPAIVAVDGGADAVRAEGFDVDMIVGDMDSVTDDTLRSGAELVVHAYPDGRAPGRERLEELGLPHKVVPAPGTSQDVAMLIASEKGASLLVSVGSQLNLIEFLDKSRRGMSSTFLTRLRIGEKLVDAKGVSRLYRPRPGVAPLGFVIAAGLAALAAVIIVTSGFYNLGDLLWENVKLLLGVD